MSLHSWLDHVTSVSSRRRAPRVRTGSLRRRGSARHKPFLEQLEDRTVLSAPYVVNTTADSGPGSLRDAIAEVNTDTSHTLYPSPGNPSVDEIMGRWRDIQKDLLKLARHPNVVAITPNVPVHTSAYEDNTMWQDSTDMSILQNAFDPNTGEITGPAPQAPAIAIVDSGVQARADFGSRLVTQVNLCSLCTDSSNDETARL